MGGVTSIGSVFINDHYVLLPSEVLFYFVNKKTLFNTSTLALLSHSNAMQSAIVPIKCM